MSLRANRGLNGTFVFGAVLIMTWNKRASNLSWKLRRLSNMSYHLCSTPHPDAHPRLLYPGLVFGLLVSHFHPRCLPLEGVGACVRAFFSRRASRGTLLPVQRSRRGDCRGAGDKGIIVTVC